MLVFCCKQKTAYEMRISDWSSDVCSSDLADQAGPRIAAFEQVVAQDPVVGEAAVERLLECGDLVDPLADERALAEQVLVHVGHRARVRIDARLAAVQARVPRARPAHPHPAAPALQESVAAADHPSPGVPAPPVNRTNV